MKRNLWIYALITASWCGLVAADCMFKIVNYSDSLLSAKVGFYGGDSRIIMVDPATTTMEKIVSTEYQCNSATTAGMGVSYISFINDTGNGGANYLPSSASISLRGQVNGAADGRLITANNGQQVWLNATGLAINENVFEVKLNFIGRPNSFTAGTQ